MRLSVIRRQSRNSSLTIGKLEQVFAWIRTGCLPKSWGGLAKRAVGTNSERRQLCPFLRLEPAGSLRVGVAGAVAYATCFTKGRII